MKKIYLEILTKEVHESSIDLQGVRIHVFECGWYNFPCLPLLLLQLLFRMHQQNAVFTGEGFKAKIPSFNHK